MLSETADLGRRGVVDARALRILGRIEMLGGNPEAAVAKLQEGVEICRSEQLRFELALTLIPLSGCVDNGSAHFTEAQAIFDELGVVEAGRFLPVESSP